MKISNFKFQMINSPVRSLLLLLLAVHCSFLIAQAGGGDDHSHGEETKAGNSAVSASNVSIVAAERNLQTAAGEFKVILKRSPSDPRTGEKGQFLMRLAEKVEGGFGDGESSPLEKAAVTASITRANGTVVAENLAAHDESNGNYHIEYVFNGAGDYKIVFNVVTVDKRNFSVDFPVSVTSAPIRSGFWLGLAVLSLLVLASIGTAVWAIRRRGAMSFKKLAPPIVAAVLIFALGTAALAYFLPPRQTRLIAEIPPNAAVSANRLESKTFLTVPKESQLLFGIKTETIGLKEVSGGLKTTGIVRPRPESKAVVVPPVAGRLILREGLALGTAVGRGEQIGYIEQVLDVAGQTALEQQRLDAEAQQRDVEARRLEIQNTVLQLKSQQTDQRAKADQARVRLAQARRELRRSENLVEVGAVPQKRLEEAQTAVKVAENEVSSAEQQVKLLENQIKQAEVGRTVFRAPTVRQPNKNFPLVSPVSGIINEIKAVSGQQVETGTEILRLANLSTVLLEAQVFEKDLPIVRESTRASFTASALSGEVYTIGTADGDGRLLSVGQAVNEQTRSVPVIYEVKNPLNRLRDGMFVEITIDTGDKKQVPAVPKTAVINEQGQTFVFIFDGGETFERRAVSLGREGALYYEIGSGLKEGERVVVEGIYQLRSTQPSA